MNPETWCKCCNGAGELEQVRYVWDFKQPPAMVKTGAMKACGGCQGAKISVRAQKYRDENRSTP